MKFHMILDTIHLHVIGYGIYGVIVTFFGMTNWMYLIVTG